MGCSRLPRLPPWRALPSRSAQPALRYARCPRSCVPRQDPSRTLHPRDPFFIEQMQEKALIQYVYSQVSLLSPHSHLLSFFQAPPSWHLASRFLNVTEGRGTLVALVADFLLGSRLRWCFPPEGSARVVVSPCRPARQEKILRQQVTVLLEGPEKARRASFSDYDTDLNTPQETKKLLNHF